MKRWVLAVAVLVAGCSCGTSDRASEPGPSATKLADPSDVIDQDLMIALGQAKNLHHKAKILVNDGKADDAIAAIRQILSLQFPKGAPEGEDVRNDARAMLAKLLVGKKELDEAMRVVDEGIAQSTRESFFVANLHTVKGEIHEARGELKDAIVEYDRSIKIDEALQKHLLEQR